MTDQSKAARSAATLALIIEANLGTPEMETEREVDETELNDDGMYRLPSV